MFTNFSKSSKSKNPNDISNFFKTPTFLDVQWYENYLRVSRFRKNKFRFPRIISQKNTKNDEIENALGLWVKTQQNNFKNKTLSVEQQSLLETLEFIEVSPKKLSFLENQRETQWLESYNKVLEFKKLQNKFPAQIPPSRQINKSETNENSLGIWLGRQRKNYKKNSLSSEKIKLLESIEFIWDGLKVPTNLMEKRLLAFLKTNGKLPTYKENNTENKILVKIYEDYVECKLDIELANILTSMGYEDWMNNKRKILTWDEMFNEVKIFIKNNAKLPTYNVNINSKEENRLASWLSNQRNYFINKKLNPENEQRLLELLGRLDKKQVLNEEIWEQKYEQLCEYIKLHNSFPKLSNNKENNKIANWLLNQINWANGNLAKNGPYPIERKNKLIQVGVNFSKSTRNSVDWNTQFEDLRFYMLENNNRTPSYNEQYSINGNLGVWCFNQRQLYKSGKLKLERAEKLKSLGFDFNSNGENRTIGINAYYRKEWLLNYNEITNIIKTNLLDSIQDTKLNTWYLKNKKLYLKNKLEVWKEELWSKI